MPLSGWSSQQGSLTTLSHCSLNCTGSRFQSESGSGYVCWTRPTAASTALRLTTLLRPSDQSLYNSRGTRQRLRSAETLTLLVPSTRRSTLGDRSLPVVAARAWNALPQHFRNAPSLSVFRRALKTVLFRSSFPDAIWQCTMLYLRACRSVLIYHHILAATDWFCWHCTVVLQQQCDNASAT